MLLYKKCTYYKKKQFLVSCKAHGRIRCEMAFPLQTRYCSGHSRGNAGDKIRSEGGIPVPWQGVDLAPFGSILLPHPGITLNRVSVARLGGLGLAYKGQPMSSCLATHVFMRSVY